MRAIFLADGNILTTGFSRMSERQVALWNMVSYGQVLLVWGNLKHSCTFLVVYVAHASACLYWNKLQFILQTYYNNQH